MQPVPVSAVVAVVRELLDSSEYFSDLWVVGEVSNYNRSPQGHRYFSLKDPHGVLRAVLFRDTMFGMVLKNGDRVLAHGRVTVYQQRGDLQFVCDFVRPEGVGILAARYEELKLRLGNEGLFDPARKRPLPRFPLRIGLVTSTAGAALQDIRHVLSRRWPLAEVVLAPSLMQGEQSAPLVVQALQRLTGEHIELAIVARGGGSAEDLWAFNDERVARAIFGFPVPVVTGIGHETDESIADLVADVRAPTPSAAAERATPDIFDLERRIAALDRTLIASVTGQVQAMRDRLDILTHRIDRRIPDPEALRLAVARVEARTAAALAHRTATDRARLDGLERRMGSLDPRATLARGFAIVQDAKSGKVVNSVRRVKPGARLSVSVTDGAFWTEVS